MKHDFIAEATEKSRYRISLAALYTGLAIDSAASSFHPQLPETLISLDDIADPTRIAQILTDEMKTLEKRVMPFADFPLKLGPIRFIHAEELMEVIKSVYSHKTHVALLTTQGYQRVVELAGVPSSDIIYIDKIEHFDDIVKKCREKKASSLIAVGGEREQNIAKSVGILLNHEGHTLLDLYQRKIPVKCIDSSHVVLILCEPGIVNIGALLGYEAGRPDEIYVLQRDKEAKGIDDMDSIVVELLSQAFEVVTAKKQSPLSDAFVHNALALITPENEITWDKLMMSTVLLSLAKDITGPHVVSCCLHALSCGTMANQSSILTILIPLFYDVFSTNSRVEQKLKFIFGDHMSWLKNNQKSPSTHLSYSNQLSPNELVKNIQQTPGLGDTLLTNSSLGFTQDMLSSLFSKFIFHTKYSKDN